MIIKLPVRFWFIKSWRIERLSVNTSEQGSKLLGRCRVSASNGNDDWTEVSRRHSSQMLIV